MKKRFVFGSSVADLNAFERIYVLNYFMKNRGDLLFEM